MKSFSTTRTTAHPRPSFVSNIERADVHAQRNFQDFRSATDETCVGRHQRSGGAREQAGARLEIIADTFLSMNAPVQLAAPVLLEQRKQVQPILLDRLRAESGGARPAARCGVHPAPASRWKADGTPCCASRPCKAMRSLPSICCARMAVVVHPGHFYDFPNDGYLVLSLITEPAVFREGVSRLLQALED